MTAPSTQPLAALLASHPEECAAVCAEVQSAGDRGILPWSVLSLVHPDDKGLAHEALTRAILAAATMAGIMFVGIRGESVMYLEHRRAIARQGAAAWLRGRVSEERAK